MTKLTNVLIVEQEPLILHSIQQALDSISTQYDIFCNVTSVSDYESAYSELQSSKHFNLVLMSIDSFTSNVGKPNFENQMVTILKQNSSKTKLVTLSSNCDNYLIFELMRTLNPEGMLLKRDMKFKDLVKAIDNVIHNIPFYSTTILKIVRIRMSSNISLDKNDLLILYYLSKGIRMKDLPELVFLSNSAVEGRKRSLKRLFNVERKSDLLLLEQARKKGFI